MNYKENKRYLDTKHKIFAYVQCYLKENNSVDDLNVSKICSALNISRTTFYFHYKNIDDLILDLKKCYRKKLLINVSIFSNEQSVFTRKGIKDYLEYVYENKEYYAIYKKLVTRDDYDALTASFVKKLKELNYFTNEDRINYFSCFVLNGITAVILRWITNDFKEEPAVLADIIYESLKSSALIIR